MDPFTLLPYVATILLQIRAQQAASERAREALNEQKGQHSAGMKAHDDAIKSQMKWQQKLEEQRRADAQWPLNSTPEQLLEEMTTRSADVLVTAIVVSPQTGHPGNDQFQSLLDSRMKQFLTPPDVSQWNYWYVGGLWSERHPVNDAKVQFVASRLANVPTVIVKVTTHGLFAELAMALWTLSPQRLRVNEFHPLPQHKFPIAALVAGEVFQRTQRWDEQATPILRENDFPAEQIPILLGDPRNVLRARAERILREHGRDDLARDVAQGYSIDRASENLGHETLARFVVAATALAIDGMLHKPFVPFTTPQILPGLAYEMPAAFRRGVSKTLEGLSEQLCSEAQDYQQFLDVRGLIGLTLRSLELGDRACADRILRKTLMWWGKTRQLALTPEMEWSELVAKLEQQVSSGVSTDLEDLRLGLKLTGHLDDGRLTL